MELSLFMGFTNKDHSFSKLETLIGESQNGAVLDTGCSTTVCGAAWLHTYTESLSEYDRSLIKEDVSSAKFTFGDGKSFESMKRVVLPCWIGKRRSNITVDVVSCNIPLLLSSRSMKNAQMVWDFRKDAIEIYGETIWLKKTSPGHFVLPLSM